MKKFNLVILFLLAGLSAFSQTQKRQISIIPEPQSLVVEEGSFILPKTISIQSPSGAEMGKINEILHDRFSISTGYHVSLSSKALKPVIKLVLNAKEDETKGAEGYSLTVTPKSVLLIANKPAGLFYGLQTLLQLFPKEIESASMIHLASWSAPCVEIKDRPRFAWRGLMLDVARHFFTKKEVEAYIDQMAKYKFNLFHWHLTDDEGWRIEIKSLPNLTKKGAYNVPRVGQFGTFAPIKPGEAYTQGGFYTQEDVREIVQYAKERFVNVLPEVDVPGHSLAAVVSYPELSCTPGADKYTVYSGSENFMTFTSKGNTASVDNTLCPANEKVYEFMDKILGEIATLFPFKYIHLGGDECAKNFWEKSDAVLDLMKKENLKTMDEVQSYFEKRVEKIVESKGKTLIGWDEILQGGLAPGAAVMSWRGEKGGVEATNLHHDVVMSPTTYAYLDYMQSDAVTEPHVYATLRLDKTYQFEPVPQGADAKYILGGQANLWTEQVYTYRQVEYMTWPRAFAIAESVWSPKEKKNWDSFVRKVEDHFKRFNVEEVKYCPGIYDPAFAAQDENGAVKIELRNEIEGLDTYYSFDNSIPDRFYPKYSGTLTAPIDAENLKVVTYRGKEPIGRLITMPIQELKSRISKKQTFFQ